LEKGKALWPKLGRWVSRDPVGYDGDSLNLYECVAGRPVTLVDPSGLQARAEITGECHIRIYAGHYGPDARGFLDEYNVPHPTIVNGCGNYVGMLACFSRNYIPDVPESRTIPDFPVFNRALESEAAWGTIVHARDDAEALAKTLCKNRKKFRDDGKPERYLCGDKNQRCDSVTITLHCDDAMRKLMTRGIGPSGRKIFEPTDAKKKICNFKKTYECREDDK
jgi:hypothetical protein